jgi:hypothetical protein
VPDHHRDSEAESSASPDYWSKRENESLERKMVKNSVMLERRLSGIHLNNDRQYPTTSDIPASQQRSLLTTHLRRPRCVYGDLHNTNFWVARNFYGTLDQGLLVRIAFYGPGDSALTSHK